MSALSDNETSMLSLLTVMSSCMRHSVRFRSVDAWNCNCSKCVASVHHTVVWRPPSCAIPLCAKRGSAVHMPSKCWQLTLIATALMLSLLLKRLQNQTHSQCYRHSRVLYVQETVVVGKAGAWQSTSAHSCNRPQRAIDCIFELLWIRVGATFVGSLYHPPRPQYSTESLVQYTWMPACRSLSTVSSGTRRTRRRFLPAVWPRCSRKLTSIVHQPTRGTNILDRIFTSSPCYNSVRVVKAVVRSDRKAVVARPYQRSHVAVDDSVLNWYATMAIYSVLKSYSPQVWFLAWLRW